MKKSKANQGNFWGGAEASKGAGAPVSAEVSKGATAPAGAPVGHEVTEKPNTKDKFEFDWWWLVGGIVAVAMIATAVVLNINHSHTGDNAENISGSINIDNGDQKINWDRYSTFDVNLNNLSDEENYTIKESGTYNVTGSLNDGAIIIKVTSDDVVRLILNNTTIKNSNGPAIACLSGDDLVIVLNGENYIEDGEKYSADWDEDVSGAIYSKADLSFHGDGTLTVKANYEDGIVGKDDLTFRGGTYNIAAADDGIRGKDSVHVESGTFTVDAVADAIKSTNDTDTTKGFILIENGNFTIKSGEKGIKATNSILIYGGEYNITAQDDGIHTNNYIGITGGEITIASGDDGIHADARLIIDGGTINITKSYEGLEAQKISINNGTISIAANDDGINAGGGSDSSAANNAGGRGMMDAFDSDEKCELIINGGSLYVNAAGDGLDSNGWIYINGGTVVVDGPTSNGDGALDSGAGIVMSGGTVMAVGASGMAETLGSTSSVYNISVYFTSTQAKGTKIEIKDASGNTILSHTSAKTFNHLAAGTPEFKSGETYTIYINGAKYEDFTISSTTTVVGNGNNGFQNMNGAGANGANGANGGGQRGQR